MYRILTGDVTKMLKTLADESVQCVVTSPPYWGLRNYGVEGQLGLERTPEEYVEKMVSIFHELRRVLRNDGTLFLNIGDSYMAHPNQRKDTDAAGPKQRSNVGSVGCPSRSPEDGLRAAACDTSDIEPASSASHDCLCESLCDACRRAYQIGKSHSGSRPVPTPKTLPSAPTRERRESANDHSPTLDSSGQESRTEDAIRDQPQDIESFASVLLDAQESTSPESSLPLQEGFRQLGPFFDMPIVRRLIA